MHRPARMQSGHQGPCTPCPGMGQQCLTSRAQPGAPRMLGASVALGATRPLSQHLFCPDGGHLWSCLQ